METTFDKAFDKVRELVQTFEANKHAYLKPDYAEVHTRKDFIDKFFIALGWDVNHDIQKNPYEQEVMVEIPVIIGASQRHADYAFRLAPNFNDARFLVEAKKPSSTIETKENYFQVIRYGWNSQTPLAALTDFQQFHVIDCRFVPDPDTALNRSISTFHYTEYNNCEKFALIYWLFSREAVIAGSLQKRAAELPKPRGKAVQRGLFPGAYKPVDESFLEDLDEFRIDLARAFKNTDHDLDGETLTELTQRTLDRLVFLRFLEDKGIEIQHRIDQFGDTGSVWEDFVSACRRLDGIYNGIIFKQHSILDTQTFNVDDTIFGNVCERLAAVNTPYDFNSIPIHILGSIYERFLGNVIVTTAKRVHVEEKPEVRKAGGVYYTPEYICRYIVENTVGKLIAGKIPTDIATLRFADIACGSGSFVLSIYDLLLRYHGSYYNNLSKREKSRTVKRGDCIERDGKLYLSLHKKREILVNNIFGVDIDAQAVEVTQLSLFLRLLQEETTVSARQYSLDFEHVKQMKKLLPDLSRNIICGNSLIGTDILDRQLFPSNEERKLNPMNFEDAFPDVIKHGGFDAIVGNPPYIFTRDLIAVREREYYAEKYSLGWEKQNTFMLFMEKLLQLIGPNGMGSFIVPNSWLTIESAKLLRERYLHHLRRVVDLNYPVFQGVSMEPSIFFIDCMESEAPITLARVKSAEHLASTTYLLANRLRLQNHNRIVFHGSDSVSNLVERIIETTKFLGELFDVRTGLQAYEKGKGNPPQTAEDVRNHIFDRKQRDNKYSIPYLEGRDVERYGINWSGMWMQYGPWLSQPREIGIFMRPRILLREITGHLPYCLHYTYVEKQFLNNKSILNVLDRDDNQQRLKALVGILNSRLISFFYKKQAVKSGRNIFPKVVIKDLGHFPIPKILDAKNVSKLSQKVEAMMAVKIQLGQAKTDKDKTYYQNKAASLNRQIDLIVYDIYGLTEEEIKLIEAVEDNAV